MCFTSKFLVEIYGDYALLTTTCRDWFRRFKNNDLDVEDKERSGTPKKCEIENWKNYLLKTHPMPDAK